MTSLERLKRPQRLGKKRAGMNAPATAPPIVRLPPTTDMHRKPTESSNVKLSGTGHAGERARIIAPGHARIDGADDERRRFCMRLTGTPIDFRRQFVLPRWR